MRLAKLGGSVAAAALLCAALAAPSASAAAFAPPHGNDQQSDHPVAGQFNITAVGTDAMGADTFFNRNSEYITIKNDTGSDKVITNWKVGDDWSKNSNWANPCNQFVFTENRVPVDMLDSTEVVLKAGHSVTVFMGWGNKNTTGLINHRVYDNSPKSCGANGHFINNNGDNVYLVDSSGDVKASAWFRRNGGYEVTF